MREIEVKVERMDCQWLLGVLSLPPEAWELD